MLLRNPNAISSIKNCVFFATKRSITVKSWEKFYNLNFGFNFFLPMLGKMEGYIHPRFFGFEAEALQYHLDQISLVRPHKWIEPQDGFDYESAAQNISLPRVLNVTGINDTYLGHINDVERFQTESKQKGETWLLTRESGNLQDYDHNNVVTHADALKDHFPKIVMWLKY